MELNHSILMQLECAYSESAYITIGQDVFNVIWERFIDGWQIFGLEAIDTGLKYGLGLCNGKHRLGLYGSEFLGHPSNEIEVPHKEIIWGY